MTSYKHTQVGYLMLIVAFAVLVFFANIYMSALAELPSYNSGPNLLVSAIMVLILFILFSFSALTVSVDDDYIKVKFGYGIFRKKFSLTEIAEVKMVKNKWYYGWGIRYWMSPPMWIFNVSGFDAIELNMKNGKIYRIGTDESNNLESVIKRAISIK